MSEQGSELRNIVEAALLASEMPLSVAALAALFPDDARPSPEQLKQVFEQLDRDYEGCGVELRRVGKGWRFQSREKYSPWLRKLSETRPPRYSRAMLETLAIIAYRQPVTRGDIEEIRGVTVSSDIMRQLQDRDWVREVGHRDVPGRPALLGTTQQFLEHFSLEALSDLPPLLERRQASEIALELNLRLPARSEPMDQTDQSEQSDQAAQSAEAVETPSTDETRVDPDTPEAGSSSAEEVDESGQGEDATGGDGEAAETGQSGEEARPTAQVISIGDAVTSKEGDGETS